MLRKKLSQTAVKLTQQFEKLPLARSLLRTPSPKGGRGARPRVPEYIIHNKYKYDINRYYT